MTAPMTDRRSWVRDHGLSLTLGVLFFASWLGQFVFQAQEQVNDTAAHGEAFSWTEFWPTFWQATFENWQSEFLQLLTFVVLAKHLIHRDSPQSRDGDDEMQAKIDKILTAVGGDS